MDNLLFVPDIMARYHCSAPTARKYMRQMIHMENPLAVTESALLAWERERTVCPEDNRTKPKRRPAKLIPVTDYHIPRRRA